MHPDLEKLVSRAKIDQSTAELLDSLQPDTFCFHKSWGAGKVESWDRLGVKVIINFEDKPAHEMGMKFAATSLEPVSDEHFYAQRHSNLKNLQAKAIDDPVALTKLALEGQGGKLSLDQFEAMIKGRVVPEGKYKSWWESTKKKLRNDQQLVVPAKRNEPLEMRDSDLSPADSRVDDYLKTRDLKLKVRAVEAILKDLSVFEDAAAQLLPVVEDINDSARRGRKLNLSAVTEMVLVRDDLQAKEKELLLDENQITIAELLKTNRRAIADLLHGLSLARLRQVLGSFKDAFTEDWVQVMLSQIPKCGLRSIGEIANFLADDGHSDTILEFFESGLQQRTLSSDAIAWILRERKGMTEVIFDPSVSLVVMSSLEKDSLLDEGGVKAASKLRDLLSDDLTLIPDLINEADINTVRIFASRLMGSSIFDDLTRKSLMARIVKIYPDVQDLISGGHEEREEIVIVSEASLVTKKAGYDKLVREEIPQNREDIKIARSYGDLRENFEYKSAKEYQRVLMKRKADWEHDLKFAKPSDFVGADTSRVGIGTVVTIEPSAGGDKIVYTILGAWDSDPDKSILAYLSDRGQLLLEKKIGDEAALPTGTGGTESYRILDIQAYKS